MYTEVRRTLCYILKNKMDYCWKIPQTHLWSVVFWLLIGGGTVGGCAHLLVACHLVVYDMKEKTFKCHVNRMFVWIPVSSRWRYGSDTVLIHGGIHMCDEFDVDGKLYVEVLRTWCIMAWKWTAPWHPPCLTLTPKLLITFHLQGLRMIMSELEVCGVQAVGGVC